MKNPMTKIAAVALLSLAAAPMAMAYGVVPSTDSYTSSVTVEALAPQPDLGYRNVSAADVNDANAQVRVAELGAQPRQPFATHYTSTGAAKADAVTTGSLPANALTTR